MDFTEFNQAVYAGDHLPGVSGAVLNARSEPECPSFLEKAFRSIADLEEKPLAIIRQDTGPLFFVHVAHESSYHLMIDS